MIKVLITGATGLLGTTLVPHLKKCEYKIVTHAHTSKADFMFDLSDRLTTYEMLANIQPSVIINLVSLTNVELCEEQMNSAYYVNTRTVENLADWILKSGANCHLVQISTDHLYDGIGLHTEDEITITNNYAFSKYAGELAAACIPSTIIRTNFVGRSKVSHRDSLTDWLYNAMTSGKNIQVLNDIYFSPLSMATLVKMIQIVVEKKPVGTYNLGSRNGISKADFSFSFAKILNLQTNTISRIESSQAAFFKTYRPKNMQMDSAKFESRLGVKLPLLNDEIISIAEEYYDVA